MFISIALHMKRCMEWVEAPFRYYVYMYWSHTSDRTVYIGTGLFRTGVT